MPAIWIQEETLTEKLLEDVGHYMRIEGDISSVYFISEGSEGDYVEHNKQFLQEFLIERNKFPIYLTFIPYDDQIEEYKSFLDKNDCSYTLTHLEENRTYYTLFQKHQYHPPCFTVEIEESKKLRVVMEETFWLPAQNEFYAISYANNLSFSLKSMKEWGRKRDRSVPIFEVDTDSTFITIFHDGAGFYLFSNEKDFASVESLSLNLPKGTVIDQINDTLINNEDTKN
ncbi:hypothetical protein KO561_14680 [Radiobacillus kanasensis]|uniref:hypothetical protein n=1 Tax=Radiobacillus kanasensis TaxID=2844358 RepID=UPI001E56BC21|nr:hypothetical protein [Radiobacillus kanasensis]UFT98432.1 hypothetical protein KO561_14680 [Radiobacillus kanasensis]